MVMETYHKIQTLFKRHLDGPYKGKMIRGQWTSPALEYLAGNQWDFSEKVDGTNIRVGFDKSKPVNSAVEFGGRTDRAVIPEPLLRYLEDTFFYDMFNDNDLDDITLYGEGYGPRIQNGGKYIDPKTVNDPEVPAHLKHSFVLFDVKIGDWWLERENVHDIADKLGIKSVPSLGRGTLFEAIEIVETGYTFNKQGAIVRYGSKGLDSKWGNFEAEGIVARPITPLFDRKGERIITKIKAVDFR